jgi:hypothetical protein
VSGVKTRTEVCTKYDNLKRGGDIKKFYTALPKPPSRTMSMIFEGRISFVDSGVYIV